MMMKSSTLTTSVILGFRVLSHPSGVPSALHSIFMFHCFSCSVHYLQLFVISHVVDAISGVNLFGYPYCFFPHLFFRYLEWFSLAIFTILKLTTYDPIRDSSSQPPNPITPRPDFRFRITGSSGLSSRFCQNVSHSTTPSPMWLNQPDSGTLVQDREMNKFRSMRVILACVLGKTAIRHLRPGDLRL